MKRLFLPLLSLVMIISLVASCSLDDDVNQNLDLQLIAIDSVQIPDTLQFGKNYNFDIFYTRPTTCHNFYNFNYGGDENDSHVRNIAVVNSIYKQADCDTLTDDNVISKELRLAVERNDYYLFRFYNGRDANGKAVYLEKEVPVSDHVSEEEDE